MNEKEESIRNPFIRPSVFFGMGFHFQSLCPWTLPLLIKDGPLSVSQPANGMKTWRKYEYNKDEGAIRDWRLKYKEYDWTKSEGIIVLILIKRQDIKELVIYQRTNILS
jgi:hypothetical protein